MKRPTFDLSAIDTFLAQTNTLVSQARCRSAVDRLLSGHPPTPPPLGYRANVVEVDILDSLHQEPASRGRFYDCCEGRGDCEGEIAIDRGMYQIIKQETWQGEDDEFITTYGYVLMSDLYGGEEVASDRNEACGYTSAKAAWLDNDAWIEPDYNEEDE